MRYPWVWIGMQLPVHTWLFTLLYQVHPVELTAQIS